MFFLSSPVVLVVAAAALVIEVKVGFVAGSIFSEHPSRFDHGP